MQNLFEQNGSKPQKTPRFGQIFLDRMFTGIWTQRNPLRDPSGLSQSKYYGGRPDALIAGVNVELTNRLTLARSPGTSAYSTATFPGAVNSFYPFKQFTNVNPDPRLPDQLAEVITLMVDDATTIYTLNPTAKTSIFTKSNGAGNTTFLGVGNTLYFGDGVDQKAYQNGAVRNWGIAIGSITGTGPSGPNFVSSGTDTGAPIGNPGWNNLVGVTAAGSSVSYTYSLAATSDTATTNLNATTAGFSIPFGSPIIGIEVSFSTPADVAGGSYNFDLTLLKNGFPTGNTKTVSVAAFGAGTTFTLGGTSDLWNSSWTYSDINNVNFGVQFNANSPSFSPGFGWTPALYQVTITVYTSSLGPTVAFGPGTLAPATGYRYVYEFSNVTSGAFSAATPPSSLIKPINQGVLVEITPSNDPQVNQIYVFRTKDGGSIYYSLPTNSYPNFSATITATSLTSNVATFTGANNLQAGMYVTTTGSSHNSAFNVTEQPVVSANLNSFTVAVVHADIPSAADSPAVAFFILDNAPDETLNLLQLADTTGLNTPPANGLIAPAYHMGRVFGAVGNVVYYSAGPDLGNILGNGNESFPPANYFTYPSLVIKLVPTAVGLLVFTVSDIYIIYGNGSALSAATGISGITVFYSVPFLANIGLSSYFALDVNGSTIYMSANDGQVLSLDPSSGVNEFGYAIGAPSPAYPTDYSLASFVPSQSYLTWHVDGSAEKAVYLSDGSTGWFRCNTNQAPDGGFVWSPKRNITGGCKAVQSIETSPGVHQLLIGPGSGGGQVKFRNPDRVFAITNTSLTSNVATYTASNTLSAGQYVNVFNTSNGSGVFNVTNQPVVSASATEFTIAITNTNVPSLADSGTVTLANSDNGNTYPANFTMGNIVLAQPGQLAEIGFVTCDFIRIGASPLFSLLMDEINGTFESLSGYVHSDPPSLYGVSDHPDTLYSNRYDARQTVTGGNSDNTPLIFCRHLQLYIDFGSDAAANELLTLTIYGTHYVED